MTPPATTAKPVRSAAGAERVLRADARRNRVAILEAARKRFAGDGLDAQIDEIARAAGVGVGTVYRHFPTKDDLVEALIADRFDRIAEWAREALDEDDAWEAFRRFMYRSAELQAHDRALSEAMASRPEKMRQSAIDSGVYALAEQLVARAQESGEMRADAVTDDVPTVICGLGRVTQAASGESTMSWERFLAIMLDGLRARDDCSHLPCR